MRRWPKWLKVVAITLVAAVWLNIGWWTGVWFEKANDSGVIGHTFWFGLTGSGQATVDPTRFSSLFTSDPLVSVFGGLAPIVLFIAWTFVLTVKAALFLWWFFLEGGMFKVFFATLLSSAITVVVTFFAVAIWTVIRHGKS
ncbi:MAG: hypothetical protein HYS57_01990 [Parcubacteria group bacterium]|nr:hypothetical protein [Parcubacteria group bacterium]